MCFLFSFETAFSALASGSRLVLLRRFDMKTLCQVIEKYQVTFLLAVPALLETMIVDDVSRDFDLSTLRYVMFSGDSLLSEKAKTLRKKYNLKHLLNDYGTSETGNLMIAPVDDDGRCHFNTFASCQQFKVVDVDTGEAVAQQHGGELLVRSPLMMKCYRNRPRESRDAYTWDGFLRTGDLAYFDDWGSIHLVGRHKNIIKYKGYQVAPLELESVLMQHEAVSSAVVVGIPHPKFGEVPRAYVVLHQGHENRVSVKEIQDFVAERTASYKHLRGGVEFLQDFPRSAFGKILRRKLREDYEKRFVWSKSMSPNSI